MKRGHIFSCASDFLPLDLYRACLAHWPPEASFDATNPARARITAGNLAVTKMPDDVRDFWRRFVVFINRIIKPLLIEAYMPFLDQKLADFPPQTIEWAKRNLAFFDHENEGLNLDRGFTIGPHVDQNFIFVSLLLYMPAGRERRGEGTTLYTAPAGVRSKDTEFLDPTLFEPMLTFPFRKNTLVSFLQSPIAFHGKAPTKSKTPRRSYQFNVTLAPAVVERLYR